MPDIEKSIIGLEHCRIGDCVGCPYDQIKEESLHGKHDKLELVCNEQLTEDILTLLREQEPKTPIHIHEEYPEHDWRTDEDGEIDEWAMEDDIHHGPSCKRCGYTFCMYCSPNGWEKPCIIDYYKCPKCGTRIFRSDGETMYCKRCGQQVKWQIT